MVKVASSHVDTHVAAATVSRTTHIGAVVGGLVVDLVVVLGLRNLGSCHHRPKDKRAIAAGNGGSIVLLVTVACCNVDAHVTGGTRGRVVHVGSVFSPFIADVVASAGLFIGGVGSGAGIGGVFWIYVMTMMMMLVITLASLDRKSVV